MSFDISKATVLIATHGYITWFQDTVNRQETINLVNDYRDNLGTLNWYRNLDAPINRHWVPSRMEALYERNSYLTDRLDDIFTYKPDPDITATYQFDWMSLIEKKLIQEMERESGPEWIEPIPGGGEKEEKPNKRAFNEPLAHKLNFARDVMHTRAVKHSKLRAIARAAYKEAEPLKKRIDLFADQENPGTYLKGLMAEYEKLRKRASYHYAMAMTFKQKRLDPVVKRYHEISLPPLRQSALAWSQDNARETWRENEFDPYFKEREMPGHRLMVCRACCQREDEIQTSETSYPGAVCYNPECPEHGEPLMQLEEYHRLMRAPQFREETLTLQGEYHKATDYDTQQAYRLAEHREFLYIQKMNRDQNLRIRANLRVFGAKPKFVEEDVQLLA